MATNKYLELVDAIDAARVKTALIRQGILRPFEPHALNTIGRQTPLWASLIAGKKSKVDFRIPATRSYRLTNSKGASSFHFSHRAITKVTYATCIEGVRIKPGAARAHSKYIEREEAVAKLGLSPDELHKISGEPATQMSSSNHHERAASKSKDEDAQHKENIYDQNDQHTVDSQIAIRLVDELGIFESSAAEPCLGRPVEDAGSDARLRLLSRRDLVRDGRRTDGVLLSAQDVSLASRASTLGLRQSPPGDCEDRAECDVPTLKAAFELGSHDRYLIRMEAISSQPDGNRALITNIDPDDEKRAKFWSLVEQHEADARPDEMSLCIADNPDF